MKLWLLATAEQIHPTKEAFNSHFTSHTHPPPQNFKELSVRTRNSDEISSGKSWNDEPLVYNEVFGPGKEGRKTHSKRGRGEERRKKSGIIGFALSANTG